MMTSTLAGKHDSPSPEKIKYKIIDLSDKRKAPPIDVEERMKTLSDMLSNPIFSHQHQNIEAVMAMYKNGATPTTSRPWWFVDGDFLTIQPELEKLPYGSIVFVEVSLWSHWSLSYANWSIRDPAIRWWTGRPRRLEVYVLCRLQSASLTRSGAFPLCTLDRVRSYRRKQYAKSMLTWFSNIHIW